MICDAAGGTLNLFDPKTLFSLYYFDIFAISGGYVLLSGQPRYLGTELNVDNSPFFVEALVLAICGILCFQIGCRTRLGQSIACQLPRPGDFRRLWVSAVVWGGLFCGILASLYFFYAQGGVTEFLAHQEQWRNTGVMGDGPLTFFMAYLMPMCALINVINAMPIIRRKSSLFGALVLFAVSLLPSALLGFRGIFIIAFMQLMTVWHYRHSRIPWKKFVALGATVILLATIYGVFREGRGLKADTAADDLMSTLARCRGLEVVAVVLHDMNADRQFQYGWRSALETATILVPRGLLPEKITPGGIRFTTEFFSPYIYRLEHTERESYGGISPTIVGELYWNFGTLGVLAGMALMGVAARTVESYVKMDVVPTDGTLFAYATFIGSFWAMAEAPQGTMNLYVIRFTVVGVLVTILSHRARQKSMAYVR
jgi:hypothetical protein